MKKVRISMTSWPPRIDNVRLVIESMLKQTVALDSIELNLAKPNFVEIDTNGNEIINLPKELVDFIDKNDIIHINWVEKDTKTFKKLIPTLQKYSGEDFYVLTVDDDTLYKENYVETMIDKLQKTKSDSFAMSTNLIIGGRMIYESTAFESDFWNKLTDEVIATGIDDFYIQCYLESHGKKLGHLSSRDTSFFNVFNEVKPLHDVYKATGFLDDVYIKIRRLFGK